MAVPVDGFGFGGGWFHGFATAGYATSGFATAGLAAVGFEEQLSVSSSIRYTIPTLLNPPVSGTQHNAMLPNPMWQNPLVYLVPFLTDTTIA